MLNMKKAIAAVGALLCLQVCLPDAVRAAAWPDVGGTATPG